MSLDLYLSSFVLEKGTACSSSRQKTVSYRERDNKFAVQLADTNSKPRQRGRKRVIQGNQKYHLTVSSRNMAFKPASVWRIVNIFSIKRRFPFFRFLSRSSRCPEQKDNGTVVKWHKDCRPVRNYYMIPASVFLLFSHQNTTQTPRQWYQLSSSWCLAGADVCHVRSTVRSLFFICCLQAYTVACSILLRHTHSSVEELVKLQAVPCVKKKINPSRVDTYKEDDNSRFSGFTSVSRFMSAPCPVSSILYTEANKDSKNNLRLMEELLWMDEKKEKGTEWHLSQEKLNSFTIFHQSCFEKHDTVHTGSCRTNTDPGPVFSCHITKTKVIPFQYFYPLNLNIFPES